MNSYNYNNSKRLYDKKNKNYRRIRISTRISKENERKEKNVSSLLVVGKDGNPKGLITERDLVSQKGMHQ
jgi:CBS domain-containing protein